MALERLQGLLGGGNPLFDLGIGLLSASGPRPVGTANFGTRLGEATQFASQRQRAAMQNEAFRQQIMEQKKRQAAQQQLTGLLQAPERTPAGQPLPPGGGVMATQDMRQGELMGLLSQASPEAFNSQLTQGILGQMFQQPRGETGVAAQLRSAGIDPSSPEGRELIVGSIRGRGATDEMLKAVQLQLQSMQLSDLQQQRAKAQETEAQERKQLEISVHSTLEEGQELARLNDRLERTELETGQPFNQLYRGMIAGGAPFLEKLGVDTSEARQTVADFDRFNKLSTSFALDLIDRMSGTLTDNKLATLQSIMAGIGTSPGANRLIISDVLQAALDGADIEKIDVPDRGQIESLIQTLKGTGVDLPDETVIDVPEAARRTTEAARRLSTRAADIGRMGIEQLQQLDISQLSEEALKAASDRWEQLNAR